jgi:hypothetical protein
MYLNYLDVLISKIDFLNNNNTFLFSQTIGFVCLTESDFLEIILQTFLCLFVIKKVGQRKTLSSQRKI